MNACFFHLSYKKNILEINFESVFMNSLPV